MGDAGSGAAVTRDDVRNRYAAAARSVLGRPARDACPPKARDDCCTPNGPGDCERGECHGSAALDPSEGLGSGQYSASERAELPDAAVEASLGCGNPLLVADLRLGETVLDL